MPQRRIVFWTNTAAIGIGVAAYRCVAQLEADALSPVAEGVLAGTIGIAAAAIARFIANCMARDPDEAWLDAFPRPRPRCGTGSSHEIDCVG